MLFKLLIVLTLLGIAWLVSKRRMRRWLILPLTIITLVYGVMTSSPVLNLATRGLLAFLPNNSTQVIQADAIVILGRGGAQRSSRVAEAADLWQHQQAPQIFVSGIGDSFHMVQSLVDTGIPEIELGGENCSLTTRENAQFTAAILGPAGVRSLHLVTDAPHLLRSSLVFQSLGFEVIPHEVSLPSVFSRNERAFIIYREYAALLAYALQGYFKKEPDSALVHPPDAVLERISEWDCQIQSG